MIFRRHLPHSISRGLNLAEIHFLPLPETHAVCTTSRIGFSAIPRNYRTCHFSRVWPPRDPCFIALAVVGIWEPFYMRARSFFRRNRPFLCRDRVVKRGRLDQGASWSKPRFYWRRFAIFLPVYYQSLKPSTLCRICRGNSVFFSGGRGIYRSEKIPIFPTFVGEILSILLPFLFVIL